MVLGDGWALREQIHVEGICVQRTAAHCGIQLSGEVGVGMEETAGYKENSCMLGVQHNVERTCGVEGKAECRTNS